MVAILTRGLLHTHTTRASELSMWEQLSLAAFLQKYWADNQVGVCVKMASCLLHASNLCCPPSQVSCTVSFDPETEARHLPHALDYFQYHLKVWSVAAAPCRCRGLTHSLSWGQGVSFLPRTKTGAYAQMPYEAITEEAYYSMVTPSGGRGGCGGVFQQCIGSAHTLLLQLEGLEPLDFAGMLGADAVMPDKFCDAPSCEVPS